MRKAFTKRLTEIREADRLLAGGKALGLSSLVRAGVCVPQGFVVTTESLNESLRATNLSDSVTEVLRGDDGAARSEVARRLADMRLPQHIRQVIEAEVAWLDSPLLAVRSSATVEDAEYAAWAGVFHTLLNVPRAEVLDAIRSCWQHLLDTRVSEYQSAKGLSSNGLELAVIVQAMVQSEVSGVAFSIEPNSAHANNLVIEACYGLGDALVGGQIAPDTYILGRNPLVVASKRIRVQSQFHAPNQTAGVHLSPLPLDKGTKATLTDTELLALGRDVLQIEETLGHPVDVEWALANSRFCYLQARPITTSQLLQSELVPRPESTEIRLVRAFTETDYSLVFAAARVKFLFAAILAEAYRHVGSIFLFTGERFLQYTPESKIKVEARSGLDRFGQANAWKEYRAQLTKLAERLQLLRPPATAVPQTSMKKA